MTRPARKGLGLGLFIAAVCAASVVSFLVARLVQLQSGYATAQQNQVAMCALRDVTRDNVRKGRKSLKFARRYLHNHPHGIPSLQLSHAQLQRSVDDQADTLARQKAAKAALDLLICPP